MPEPEKEEPEAQEKCRWDDDSGGVCTKPKCKYFSEHRHHQDISETPAPQQWDVTTF